jgi:transposase-like protein
LKPVYTAPTEEAIEATNRQIRKVITTKGHLPNDDSTLTILFQKRRHFDRARCPHHADDRGRDRLKDSLGA